MELCTDLFILLGLSFVGAPWGLGEFTIASLRGVWVSCVTAVLRDVLLTLQSDGPTCCVPTITFSFVIAVFSTMT